MESVWLPWLSWWVTRREHCITPMPCTWPCLPSESILSSKKRNILKTFSLKCPCYKEAEMTIKLRLLSYEVYILPARHWLYTFCLFLYTVPYFIGRVASFAAVKDLWRIPSHFNRLMIYGWRSLEDSHRATVSAGPAKCVPQWWDALYAEKDLPSCGAGHSNSNQIPNFCKVEK